ncbi:hypothetical protein D3C85_956320 [compost metagenome]
MPDVNQEAASRRSGKVHQPACRLKLANIRHWEHLEGNISTYLGNLIAQQSEILRHRLDRYAAITEVADHFDMLGADLDRRFQPQLAHLVRSGARITPGKPVG